MTIYRCWRCDSKPKIYKKDRLISYRCPKCGFPDKSWTHCYDADRAIEVWNHGCASESGKKKGVNDE
jgi:hypothetical protein